MTIPFNDLIGPVGALALALWVINALWTAHKEADARERAATLEWRDRSVATDARLDRLADAFEDGFKKAAPK